MDYAKAFIVGGLICVIAQVLIDKTKITSARILVLYVVSGCILTGLGVYDKLVDYAGAGAIVPLPGFGYALAVGVMREVDEVGILGVLTGGLKATAGGISVAVVCGLLASVIFNPKEKA